MSELRYPQLLETVPMAENLAPGVNPRRGAERTYLEVEPNHCVLHLAVNIDHNQIENTRRLFGVGAIPEEYRPVSGEHEGVLTLSGGVYINVLTEGFVETSLGQPDLNAFSWLVGKIRYTRRPA